MKFANPNVDLRDIFIEILKSSATTPSWAITLLEDVRMIKDALPKLLK